MSGLTTVFILKASDSSLGGVGREHVEEVVLANPYLWCFR